MNPCMAISVNGGGALGIGPLAFMTRMEQDFGKKLCDMTFAYGGTSTGSIIAAGLAEGLQAHEIFDLYMTSDLNQIRHNNAVTNLAIVSNVRINHNLAIITNFSSC